jgi:predicted MPP superfamily phosphohydrolase
MAFSIEETRKRIAFLENVMESLDEFDGKAVANLSDVKYTKFESAITSLVRSLADLSPDGEGFMFDFTMVFAPDAKDTTVCLTAVHETLERLRATLNTYRLYSNHPLINQIRESKHRLLLDQDIARAEFGSVQADRLEAMGLI